MHAVRIDGGIVVIGGPQSAIVGGRRFLPGRRLSPEEAAEIGAKPIVDAPTDSELWEQGLRATGRADVLVETETAFERAPTGTEPIPQPATEAEVEAAWEDIEADLTRRAAERVLGKPVPLAIAKAVRAAKRQNPVRP